MLHKKYFNFWPGFIIFLEIMYFLYMINEKY